LKQKNLLLNSYYNAKLLLTAEYLVLFGAEALAIPLRFGQQLQVEENEQGFISWESFAYDGSCWFSGKYAFEDFSCIESSNPDISKYPRRLLLAARKINPAFCSKSGGFHVVTTLNYPLLWGLGSSSTLIAAIAGWAGIDPFQLHFEVSAGSGYDIACAITKSPLLYTLRDNKPGFEPVTFSPSFADRIFFVYQGSKQDSAEGIKTFHNRNSNPDPSIIDAAGQFTQRMLHASSLTEFEQVLLAHEMLISDMTGVPSIRKTRFNDLPGEVKSLGAWGGDFCMLSWHDDPELLSGYLKSKDLETWFNFNDIVL